MEPEDKPTWLRFRDAISESAKLTKDEKHRDALALVDQAIGDVIQQSESRWVLTLSHHAAVISSFIGDQQLVKHYYEQSLAQVPVNPRALYGLAEVASEQGEADIARQYATRCYKAIVYTNDEMLRQSLLDLVIKHWPEVAEK